jgi:phosphoglycerate dehydrogenase-like enzyme
MQKQTLIVTHKINQTLVEQIKEVVPNWNVIASKDSSSWINELKNAEIIAGWRQEVYDHCFQEGSNLEWVQCWSAGVNSLPLSEMEARNIKLTSANGVHSFPISETIFALMLGLTRNIHKYVRNQSSKTWHHANLKHEIHNKTIGIIGVGAIGKETAKLAKAFGMKVLGVRYSGRDEEFVDEMYRQEQLNAVLPQCDYVVVTLPLTKDTKDMFGSEQFALMKSTAFFINIGRGETVREKELITALKEQQIAGAGLDVFGTEPLPGDSPLWNLENVIITPHTSGATENYDERVIQDIFIPNLKRHLKGETPSINLVDYTKGY